MKNIAAETKGRKYFDEVRIGCKFQMIIKPLFVSNYSLKWGKNTKL